MRDIANPLSLGGETKTHAAHTTGGLDRTATAPIGSIYGSVIVAALDSAAGNAVHTTLPAGVGYTTVSLTTNFLRAVQADSGTLRCIGEVIRAGRRTALSEASLFDADERLLAHATATSMILSSQ